MSQLAQSCWQLPSYGHAYPCVLWAIFSLHRCQDQQTPVLQLENKGRSERAFDYLSRSSLLPLTIHIKELGAEDLAVQFTSLMCDRIIRCRRPTIDHTPSGVVSLLIRVGHLSYHDSSYIPFPLYQCPLFNSRAWTKKNSPSKNTTGSLKHSRTSFSLDEVFV